MRRLKWLLRVASCVVLLPIMTVAKADDEILIGVTYDAAKQAAFYSLPQKAGLEFLQEDVNARGGVLGRKVRFIFRDDENNPVIAAQRVEQFNAEGVIFSMGIGSSATGLANQQKSQALGIPNGSPGNGASNLTKPVAPSYYFRITVPDTALAGVLIGYIKKNVQNPKTAVVSDSSATGLAFTDGAINSLESADLKPVTVERVPIGASNVVPQALRIKLSGANVVLMPFASMPEMVNYVKAHRQVGNDALMMGISTAAYPEFIRLAGPAANGVVFSDIVDWDRPDVKDIMDRFVKAEGSTYEGYPGVIQGYDFGLLVLDSIKAVGALDRMKLRDQIEKTERRPSLLGPPGNTISFSPTNHDGMSGPDSVVLKRIENGRHVVIK